MRRPSLIVACCALVGSVVACSTEGPAEGVAAPGVAPDVAPTATSIDPATSTSGPTSSAPSTSVTTTTEVPASTATTASSLAPTSTVATAATTTSINTVATTTSAPTTVVTTTTEFVYVPEPAAGGLVVGGQGPRTLKLQQDLILLGYLPPAADDGNYGPGTAGGVRRFQEVAGLEMDGVAGPLTLDALALAVEAAVAGDF